MCGIIGYVGAGDVVDVVHQGLINLEYRGYDSAGIAVRADGELLVEKTAGSIDAFEPPVADGATSAIGHTRWSTHGPPTERNAHPHLDCDDSIAVVHNGIIENYTELKAELEDHGFVSETDTEVVPHLIEDAFEDDPDQSLVEVVSSVTDRLEGSYAICVLRRDEDEIVATRDGSPLVLGHDEDGSFVASDVPAFLEHTREVSYLADGQVAALSADGIDVYEAGELVDLEVETVDWEPEAAQKAGYDHFMRKEIHEQPTALRQALTGRLDDEAGEVDLEVSFPDGYLDSLEEVQFVAAGTSYYAALFGARLVESLADLRTSVFLASEYDGGAGRDPWRTLTVAVTQSGETKDTMDAIGVAADLGAGTLAVTNVVGSSVTRAVDQTVYIRAGPEIGVAASKSFASQVMTLAMVAIFLGRARGTLSRSAARRRIDELGSVPGAIQQVLDVEEEVRETAAEYLDAEAFFFIGREVGYPVSLEGALKLKEIAYVHAEGFAAGELKHGPLALVTEESPVLSVLTAGTAPERTRHNVAEAQARGAPAIGFVTEGLDIDQLDVAFTVPDVGWMEPLVANVYLQLFAYHVANELDRPIDKPRNLAKSVTVG